MDKYKAESVLIDIDRNIVLRRYERVKILTVKNTLLEGKVMYLGDGCVTFEDNIRIYFNDISSLEVVV